MKVLPKVLSPLFKSFLTLLACLPLLSSGNEANMFTLSGEIKQGGYVLGKVQPGARVMLDGKPLQVSPTGDFAFGIGRDETEAKQLTIEENGKKIDRFLPVQTREYKLQKINGISPRLMNPSEQDLERIALDSKQVKAARSGLSDYSYFARGFIKPTKGRITGVYGSQRIYNDKPGNPHFGIDYANKTGTPVLAPAAGKVVLWVPDMFFSGGTMIIDHGHGIFSTFIHLSDAYVSVGTDVKQGEKVAAIGSTGRSTGPHLDWRVNWFDVRIDPQLVLDTPAIP
ncbi:M23 family metallopeptidase [Thalassotalea agarivorans]|uniref:Murein DD-endopeptidase MepM and murein hydrolase activator NlpD, contain LysM domain n=1 Tax=Thalassotalea agarivorans TaxID=349064 RepID=A0A1I0F1E5_THASX|nr:M23 family metallopeptidase [Thalassotalea agarivorans]SET51824.1 Murein DD-endopeptidase MepM and murein hydrolase activator NlpD, contain LysM domain [Thalassotalea agarivorans]